MRRTPADIVLDLAVLHLELAHALAAPVVPEPPVKPEPPTPPVVPPEPPVDPPGPDITPPTPDITPPTPDITPPGPDITPLPATDRPLVTDAQIGVLIRLVKTGHPEMQQVEELARNPDAYGDKGEFDGLMYFATSDPDWAREAIAKGLSKFAPTPGNLNDTREDLIFWALQWGWLWRDMTRDERNQWCARLKEWVRFVFDCPEHPFKGQGMGGGRLDDSDATVGGYLGTRLVLRLAPGLVDDIVATPAMWGPKATGLDDQRQAIREFCARAKGGEWIESSGYNPGTLMLLFLGCGALGLDEFPEVAALGRQVAQWLPWTITPDLKQGAEWGDDPWPRDPEQHGQVIGLCGILSGLGLDPTGSARALQARLKQGRRPYDYYHHLARMLWVQDPESPVPDVPQPEGFQVSPGVGLVVHRGPEHLLSVFAPNPTRVDHQVKHTCDVRLWRKGEWVLDHPQGYNLSPSAVNGVLLSGLGNMHEYGMANTGGNAALAQIGWQTSGPHTHPGYYDPPPAFVVRYGRLVQFHPDGAIRVLDVFDGSDPLTLPKFDRYYADVQTAIRNRPALWCVVWHCPAEPTAIEGGYTWTTAGGQTVKLTYNTEGGTVRAEVVKTEPGKTIDGYFSAAELTGYQIRLLSDDPRVTITTTITVEG